MSEEVVEAKEESLPEQEVKESKKLFDNSPVTNEELQKGIFDWAESITQVNLAARALQDSLVNKHEEESRTAMNRLNTAAHNLNLYLISRGV